jgi:hypothetical protein
MIVYIMEEKTILPDFYFHVMASGESETLRSGTEAEFLDEVQTKVLRVFLLAIHLYSFALRFIFLQTNATSNSF